MTENYRKIILDICKKTLDTKINLVEFYSSWPKETPENDFLDQIWEDLEDAIAHQPGYFLKKGINRKSWENSYEYLIVYLDYSLLLLDKKDEDLIHLRNNILKQKDISVSDINIAISNIKSD